MEPRCHRYRTMHRLLVALAVVGCGSSSGTPDAPPQDVFFTGELVDWDSTSSKFCGVFEASWQLHADVTKRDLTSPNGRFELTVPAGAQIDVVPPTAASQCTAGSYATRGLAVVDQAAIARGATFSARLFTTARRDTVFAAVGAPYSAARAHVLVHTGAAAAVSTTAAHDAAQAWDGAAWTASSTGVYVFLPNVTIPTSNTVTISVAGGRTVEVPVAADTITYVSP